MRITDTFMEVKKDPSLRHRASQPMIRISMSKGYNGAARILLSKAIQHKIGFQAGIKQYARIYISATTIKLTPCDKDDRNARLLAAGGFLTARELVDLLQLREGDSFACKAEVAGGEVWASYPKELRERIEQLNGVGR